MRAVNGLHHVTAISGPAQENLDFYAGVLGMRLVKRSVNQDDPGTYHLFYADAEGHAGTDLTFFPWAHMAPSREGHGLASEVALAVPAGSLDWWGARLDALRRTRRRRSNRASASASCRSSIRTACTSRWSRPRQTVGRGFTPWEASPVPVERQIRGLHGARVVERDPAATAAFLTSVLGFTPHGHRGRLAALITASPADLRRQRTPHRRRAGCQTRAAAPGAPAASTISPGASTTTRTSSRCGRRSRAAARIRRR